MIDLPHKNDPSLPLAMWIFAAVVVVTFFGMVVTSTHVALRPTFGPAPTAVSKQG
jgi:hypothetical protein